MMKNALLRLVKKTAEILDMQRSNLTKGLDSLARIIRKIWNRRFFGWFPISIRSIYHMNSSKFCMLTLLMVSVFAGLVGAEWKSLGDACGPSPLQIKVLSSDASQIKLEVTVPGYNEEIVQVGKEKCLHLTVPGSHELHCRAFPLLPMLGKMIQIDDQRNVELQVVDVESVEIALPLRIVPSKGHFTRNIDPSTVPYVFGEIYQKDQFWPPKAVTLGQPFILRDVRGVRLGVIPFCPNHVQMKMKVLKKFIAVISYTGISNKNSLMRFGSQVAPSPLYVRLYSQAFLNYAPAAGVRDFPSETGKKLVLVYPDLFKTAIQSSAWYARRAAQFDLTELNLADIGSTNDAIKAKLQELYDNVATRPTYVILFGDTDTMPTCFGKFEGAAADRVYVRLAGDDNVPDAFISRFSGDSSEIQNQLEKIVAYEDAPVAEWMDRGVLIGSLQGSPTDQQRLLWLKSGGGNDEHYVPDNGLEGFGYTGFTEVYLNGTGEQSTIAAGINAGVSIICYCGHGSKTSWVSSGFNNNDVANLTNSNGMLPVIWSVACVNGDFSSGDPCFAEAWLRKANGGAVAMEAASTNEAWVPPCVKQAGTITAFITKKAKTFGALEAAGLMDAFATYGTDDTSAANQLAEQCNLFGDCTLIARRPLQDFVGAHFPKPNVQQGYTAIFPFADGGMRAAQIISPAVTFARNDKQLPLFKATRVDSVGKGMKRQFASRSLPVIAEAGQRQGWQIISDHNVALQAKALQWLKIPGEKLCLIGSYLSATGQSLGTHYYDVEKKLWTQLHKSSADAAARADIDGDGSEEAVLYFSFGDKPEWLGFKGVWYYPYTTGIWQPIFLIRPADGPVQAISWVDLDGDGAHEVAFAVACGDNRGTYLFSASKSQRSLTKIHDVPAKVLAPWTEGNITKLVASFEGYGLYAYSGTSKNSRADGWTYLDFPYCALAVNQIDTSYTPKDNRQTSPFHLLASCQVPESDQTGTFIGIFSRRGITWHRISEHVATAISPCAKMHYALMTFVDLSGVFAWPKPSRDMVSDFWQMSAENARCISGWYPTPTPTHK